MTKTSKKVRIVGKGHASCYERLLEEWYREEKFIDVILKCSNPEENLSAESVANLGLDSRSRDLYREESSKGVQANRSVLAAASSVFRDIFVVCPLVEEDVRITLVGYSTRALKAVVEYIYTGSLEFVSEDKNHVEAILRDFRIQAPTTSGDIFHQLLPVTPSPVPPPVINSPRKRVSEQFDPKIVSTMSVTSNKRANNSTSPAFINTIVESHVHNSTLSDLDNSIPLALNLIQKLPPKLPIPRLRRTPSGYTSSKSLPPSKTPVPPPTSPQDPLSIHPVVPLKRFIDVPVAPKIESTYDPPATGTPFALRKSFPEKTFINCPPFRTRLKETPKTAVESSTGFNTYRKSVSALIHEVPGIYTTWNFVTNFVRERPVQIAEKVYIIPEDPLSTHFYVPSFVKQVVRTYRDKPTGRLDNIKATERLSMKGYSIDSIHEYNGKVHIRTVGLPPINKESEGLFDDDTPISCMDPNVATAQRNLLLSAIHPGLVVMPANYDTDEAKVDYKRSIQLVSSYQRTNRKLKDRFEKLQKTTEELKKNARILLGVCKSMKDEAHESDPDYVEPVPKVVPKPNPAAVERVECDVCHKHIKKSWIRQHKLQCHTTERNHLCDECGRSYALKRQLSSHKALHHKTPGNFQCDQCGQTFKYVRYLKRHMSFHMDEKPHECKFCDKKFRLKQTLVKHLRVHTGEKPYQCKVCERRFSQRTAYVTHTKMHERAIASGKPIQPGCHRNHHTGPRENLPLLKCDFCSMTFRLELFMKLHLSKHTGEPPALPCPTCKQTFPTIRGLATHRKTEHPETVFACTQCPKIFTNKTNLDFHVKTHTDPNAPKKKYPLILPKPTGPCTCDFCGKIFKNRTSLDYHIKGIHLGSKMLKCAHCEKVFGNRLMLEQHLATHTSERPFKCDECPSTFEKSKELEAHMAVHSADLSQIPFACMHCDKTFALKASLYSHMRIHAGKKLHCSHCDKVFPNIPQLMQHEDECGNIDENSSSSSD